MGDIGRNFPDTDPRPGWKGGQQLASCATHANGRDGQDFREREQSKTVIREKTEKLRIHAMTFASNGPGNRDEIEGGGEFKTRTKAGPWGRGDRPLRATGHRDAWSDRIDER